MELSDIKRIESKDDFICKICNSQGVAIWKEQEKVDYLSSLIDGTSITHGQICSEYVDFGDDGNKPDVPEILPYETYHFKKGQWTDECENVSDDLSAYIPYTKYAYLSVYTVLTANRYLSSQILSVMDVSSGTSVLSNEITLPNYDEWMLQKWNPASNSWNPVNENTGISAVYKQGSISYELVKYYDTDNTITCNVTNPSNCSVYWNSITYYNETSADAYYSKSKVWTCSLTGDGYEDITFTMKKYGYKTTTARKKIARSIGTVNGTSDITCSQGTTSASCYFSDIKSKYPNLPDNQTSLIVKITSGSLTAEVRYNNSYIGNLTPTNNVTFDAAPNITVVELDHITSNGATVQVEWDRDNMILYKELIG